MANVDEGPDELTEAGQSAGPARAAAVALLGSRIVSGQRGYRPGDVLRLDAVMQEINGSRALAREVLQVLGHKGLVTLKARVGATVQSVERWDVFDSDVILWRLEIAPRFQMRSLTELREAVEPRAAFLAAQRASAEVCRDLVSLALELKALGMNEEFEDTAERGERCRAKYRRVDAEFHQALLKGSQNEMFSALTDQVTKALEFRIVKEWEGAPRLYPDQPEHDGDNVRRAFDAVPGARRPFPNRPEEAALWFHYGLAYAVEQGLPHAAEAFSRAILAEFQDGHLSNPDLLHALERAIRALDLNGLRATDAEPFVEAITAITRRGRT
ncbi:FadR family transcriptional regulator [Planosporangium thailandense]|uniref:FadR family transcriptional regulator n=1 Tax=Planosporangium thailandense TaxID=765197 RepID=A0ABX0Y9T1_9ACTN|nr:FCD domain-containing protein [Planosporangium thailandense]NJC74142.1 FadR family transcriptional regulator [Planosporangium thailandense]